MSNCDKGLEGSRVLCMEASARRRPTACLQPWLEHVRTGLPTAVTTHHHHLQARWLGTDVCYTTRPCRQALMRPWQMRQRQRHLQRRGRLLQRRHCRLGCQASKTCSSALVPWSADWPTWKVPTRSSLQCLWPMVTTTLWPYQCRHGETNKTSATCCRPQATVATQRQMTTETAQQLQNHRPRDGGCRGNTSNAAQ